MEGEEEDGEEEEDDETGAAFAAGAGTNAALRGATAGSTLGRTEFGAADRVSAGRAGLGADGRTGATRGPWARWTDGTGAYPRPPEPEPAPAPGPPSPSSTTATGRESLAPPRPPALDPTAGDSASLMTPVGALSRTACESDPEKEWFCQVFSEPAKSAVATVCRPGARTARWIGGRVAHARPPPPETPAAAPAPAPAPTPEPVPADASGAEPGTVPSPPPATLWLRL
ncbi:hypothetical protein [Streptomyces sp. NPDC093109]|uniref:hypothetical protein n=1 Tax=Streptomyces sp. NPDC093109 TaxID=3154977 RepID=UPI00344F9D9D